MTEASGAPAAAADSERPASDDIRRTEEPRYSCNVDTTCQPVAAPGASRLPARIREISRHEMKLVVKERPGLGVFVSVDLPTGSEGCPISVLACVARETPGCDGERILECTLAADLRDEDLEPFRSNQPTLPRPERRRWERFPCQTEAVLQVMDATGLDRRRARVTDLSAGGVGFQIAQPLPVGCLLRLALENAQGEPVLQRDGFVVHVTARPDQNDWLVGCRFARELSAAAFAGLAAIRK